MRTTDFAEKNQRYSAIETRKARIGRDLWKFRNLRFRFSFFWKKIRLGDWDYITVEFKCLSNASTIHTFTVMLEISNGHVSDSPKMILARNYVTTVSHSRLGARHVSGNNDRLIIIRTIQTLYFASLSLRWWADRLLADCRLFYNPNGLRNPPTM